MTTPIGTYTMKQALEYAGFGRFHWWLLLLTGSIYSVDASQALLQTFLIPVLEDVWDLKSPWDSMVAVAFFMGAIFGSIIWAKLADVHGRRNAIIFGSSLFAVSATATGFVTEKYGLLICRFLTGCGNAAAVSVTLFIEFSPMDCRAKSILCQMCCWTAGGLFTVLLAWLILPNMDENMGWRVYILTASIPAWIVVILSFWVPESARWYTTVGEFDKAEESVRLVFKTNRVEIIEGRLDEMDGNISARGEIKDMFVPQYRRTSGLMIINHIISIMTYFGVVFLSERVFINSSFYLCEFLTNLGEIPGLAIGLFSLDRAGRKYMMIYTRTFATVGFAIVALLWYFASTESSYVWVIMVILMLSVRGATNLNAITIFLYLSEYYPTAIRTTAVGLTLGLSKFGGIGATFLSEDLDIVTSTTVFTIVSAIGLAFSFLLQEDTTNRELTNNVDRSGCRSKRSDRLIKGRRNREYILVSTV